MTRLSPSQVAHLLDQTPTPTKPQEATGWAWGSYGGTSHRWIRCGPKTATVADCSGYVTFCTQPRLQTQKEPDGSQEQPCKDCLLAAE